MSDFPLVPFAELSLAAPVLRAVDELGYTSPTPIQAQSIPPLLAGRDLLGQARTGTGKTAAFALPLLSRIDPGRRQPQVLVLTPTRELAIQVAEAMQGYARHLPGLRVLPVYGGQSLGLQLRELRHGAQVVVGTPGRLLDHLGRGSLVLDGLAAVVLDEADEMLRMGFIDDVESILAQAPRGRQVVLFSATMPAPVARVAARHLVDPVEIRLAAGPATVASVTQGFCVVKGPQKTDALTRILATEDFEGAIVFVRTRRATEELAETLQGLGYAAAALNGDMVQAQREKVVERLRSGQLDIVVATDVAARGLDVARVTHVINYDIPFDAEAYVHRIGRTGRAGREGRAIMLVKPGERRMLRSIEQATRRSIPAMRLPTEAEIAARRIDRFKHSIDAVRADKDLQFFRGLIAAYRRERDVDADELAAALACLARPELAAVPKAPPAARAASPVEPTRRRPASADEPGVVPRGMVRYRLEVGRQHGVLPKNIVGAIANEAGLDKGNIGYIRLYDEFSTVDLPEGMPRALYRHLKGVRICGRQARISFDAPPAGRSARPDPGRAPAT